MRYIVDGYNLLFRTLRAEGDLKKQREGIVASLNARARALNLDITIVFDGAQPFSEITRSHFDCIEIVFSRESEEADDYIARRLQEDPYPQRHTVITDDNKLAWRCRIAGGKTEGIQHFLRWLEARYDKRSSSVDRPSSLPALPSEPPQVPSTPAKEDLLSLFEERLEEETKGQPKPENLLDIFEERLRELEDEP